MTTLSGMQRPYENETRAAYARAMAERRLKGLELSRPDLVGGNCLTRKRERERETARWSVNINVRRI